MSNKKLAMCNYYAMKNNSGHIIGHSDKVTKEYFRILSQDFEVSLVATPSLVKANEKEGFRKLISLPYEINADDPFTMKRRILDKLHSLKSIKMCLESEADIIFFYQVDFFLFFYLAYFYKKKPGSNIYALIFHQDFTGGKLEPLLQKIYHKGLKKLDGVLYTQPTAKLLHENKLWMPDYYYDERIYGKDRYQNKENKVVCLGSMNRFKQLEKVVEAFKNIDIPLIIRGAFDEKDRVDELIKLKGECNHIIIEDKVLEDEEYYETLRGAKYSILPYDMKQYNNRTSGVLLETIFTGGIPIAPRELLINNNCPGIGYDSLEELKIDESLAADIIESEQRIIDTYNYEFVRKQMYKLFMN